MLSKNDKIKIVADAEAMSQVAAEVIVAHLAESLRTQEFYTLALSGGSTPRRLYALLANDAKLRDQIAWDRIHFFWSDERHVPPAHPDSNYQMAHATMLSKAPIPSSHIHRVAAEQPDAVKAAEDYEEHIRRFFKIEAGQLPRFNCVLLGMGPDGHTASLFPGTSALRERERLVVANWVAQFKSYRITMTVPVLNHAHRILFLVGGKEKADIIKAVLAGRQRPERYPAQLIRPQHGKLLWILDQPAASRLSLDP